MMPEVEEAPAVGVRKSPAIFDRYVETVELAVEISPAGRLRPRAVRKCRIKDAGQFFDDDGSFGKRTRLQIHIKIFLFYVYVMIFGKSRFPVVETIRRQGSAYEDPAPIPSWKLQPSVGIKDRRRTCGTDRDRSCLDQGERSCDRQ